jgi:mRNA-degrading endonuclease toxin of MazEF toxin-antitoxin module
MTEKIYPIPRAKAQTPVGRLSAAVMDEIDSRLTFVLGHAD